MFRFAAFVVPVLSLALTGCAPSKSEIEKSIKNEMKTALGVEITAVNLSKQADGGYVGTATAADGDTYDVTARPPQGGKAEWTAVPGQAALEKTVRQSLETQTQLKVQSLSLTKQSGPGVYTGVAVFEGGERAKVDTYMEGKQVMFKAEPMP